MILIMMMIGAIMLLLQFESKLGLLMKLFSDGLIAVCWGGPT